MSDIYQVITPENIALDYEIAGIGSRFLASAIDLTLQILLLMGGAFALRLLNLGDLHNPVKNYFTSVVGGLIVFVTVLIIFLGYYVILETVWNGQTLGKRIVHIRVRKEGGYAPSFWDILLRNIIRLVDFFPFFYGTGFTVMFLNAKSKRLGDFAAATIVVKEISRKQFAKYLEAPPHPPHGTGEGDPRPEAPLLQSLIPYISAADYLLMKNLIARRASLDNYPSLAAAVLQNMMNRDIPHGRPATDQGFAGLVNQAGQILPELVALYEQLSTI